MGVEGDDDEEGEDDDDDELDETDTPLSASLWLKYNIQSILP